MLAVELRFDKKAQGDAAADSRTDAIMWLIGAFERNGSLLDDFLVAGGPSHWTVYGIAPARDAFRKANWNEFVQRRMDGLADVYLKWPLIRFLGTIPETSPACRCKKPGGFLLFTTFLDIEPPLRCIDCYGMFPQYRLPRPKTGEHSALLAWKNNYQACDTLQMNCAVGERFGERQMSQLTSSLSRQALAVCREIEQPTGRPTYYYLPRANARSRASEVRRNVRVAKATGFWRRRFTASLISGATDAVFCQTSPEGSADLSLRSRLEASLGGVRPFRAGGASGSCLASVSFLCSADSRKLHGLHRWPMSRPPGGVLNLR